MSRGNSSRYAGNEKSTLWPLGYRLSSLGRCETARCLRRRPATEGFGHTGPKTSPVAEPSNPPPPPLAFRDAPPGREPRACHRATRCVGPVGLPPEGRRKAFPDGQITSPNQNRVKPSGEKYSASVFRNFMIVCARPAST